MGQYNPKWIFITNLKETSLSIRCINVLKELRLNCNTHLAGFIGELNILFQTSGVVLMKKYEVVKSRSDALYLNQNSVTDQIMNFLIEVSRVFFNFIFMIFQFKSHSSKAIYIIIILKNVKRDNRLGEIMFRNILESNI